MASKDDDRDRLVELGFQPDECRKALDACSGDFDAALDWLVSYSSTTPTSSSGTSKTGAHREEEPEDSAPVSVEGDEDEDDYSHGSSKKKPKSTATAKPKPKKVLHSAAADPAHNWVCSACTFENQPTNTACEMCGSTPDEKKSSHESYSSSPTFTASSAAKSTKPAVDSTKTHSTKSKVVPVSSPSHLESSTSSSLASESQSHTDVVTTVPLTKKKSTAASAGGVSTSKNSAASSSLSASRRPGGPAPTSTNLGDITSFFSASSKSSASRQLPSSFSSGHPYVPAKRGPPHPPAAKPLLQPKRRRVGGVTDEEIANIAVADDSAPPELHPQLSRLAAFFLSPASCTDKEAPIQQFPKMRDSAIVDIVRRCVPNVDEIYDRTQSVPVVNLVKSTYKTGLPAYSSQPAVHAHLLQAMQFIFGVCEKLPEKPCQRHISKLVDAFTSCQAEQMRVIDSIFGELSGRDKGLRDQVISLVDGQKQRVLDEITNLLHPKAWRTSDENPAEQVPHIQSAYKAGFGASLGIRGAASASVDHNAPHLSPEDIRIGEELFRKRFSVAELARTVVDDVNQQSADADRVIDRAQLMKWAGDPAQNGGFDGNTIFYDEDNAKDYPGGDSKPNKENEYQPFLSVKVAVDLLSHLFASDLEPHKHNNVTGTGDENDPENDDDSGTSTTTSASGKS
ncbi:hypothetical protein Pelo_586 [Pelomyxa schiedti]|nr:hypothetical protein Pelo_586 [Pelomyxa schiedti]